MTAKLGFVGLGVMGGGIARRLLEAGHEVHGYNRTREKARPLEELGLVLEESPRAVAESADVVLSMVTNVPALRAVAEGDEGILAGLAPGKIWIDMTTAAPSVSRELAVKARERGADMVDAPVSGSVSTLEEGRLSIMVGGRPETFAQVEPILKDIGPKVTLVGDNGQALLLKIAINLSLAGADGGLLRGPLACREGRHRPRGGARRDALQRHRLADAEVPRPLRARAARGSMVRREHDAEGHAPGARPGPASSTCRCRRRRSRTSC